jgi:Holliday junction DNA helicase RuvB
LTVQTLVGVLPRREEYPTTWDEYIGQEHIKRQIQIAARSARMRDDVMDHMLIYSPFAGVGKTALAYLIAKELGRPMRNISGKLTIDDARVVWTACSRGDVVFYDEIHNAVVGNKKAGDWMLTLLEEGTLTGPRGPEIMPKTTLIGATTNVRMLPEPIISRFAKHYELAKYNDAEAIQIAGVMAAKLFKNIEPQPSEQNLFEIAYASNNIPRTMRDVLVNLRDLVVTEEADLDSGGGWDISEAVAWRGLTSDGLTNTALKYLAVLLDSPGTRAGKDAIAERLHEDNGLADVERLLIDKELISPTGRGRQLTSAGIRRAQQYVEAC